MRYAGGLVKHLGLAMYRGAVPSIAELIANAWDADAEHVQLSIPFGTGLSDKEIRVKDDGHGMAWDDAQTAYLVVGRDRRKALHDDLSRDKRRRVMGRKGLGKLAGFGIARLVEVRTVHDGSLTHFSMDFNDMTKGGEAELVENYRPMILADRIVDEPNGTEIILKHLLLSRPINESDFRASMARRFSILSNQFQVVINGDPLGPADEPLQFRYEGASDGGEDVPGVGFVKWWMGFTERPIQIEDARGIAVIVRGKMAQTPFFFDLSGGAYGQAGMQYMTGEVQADQLDEAEDFIGTDRQGLLWTEPTPAALLAWGESKVRDLLRTWAAERTAANERQLDATIAGMDQTVEQRIGQLQPAEQGQARQVIRQLASIDSITNEPNRARELLDLVLRAFEDSSFFTLLKALADTGQAEREQVLKLVTELDVFETVKLAEVVRARVGVISKFREMLQNNVPEKPDLQEFLFNHPWLIDPEWQVVEHETRLETLLIERFNLTRTDDPSAERRVDFFCIGTRGRFLVVEVKRPEKSIGQSEIQQIIDYVTFLRGRAPATGDPGHALSPNFYSGVLVGHHVTEDGRRWQEVAEKSGIVVRDWGELLDVAERIHREFLDVMKQKAPDDIRIQKLPPIDNENPGTAQ